MDAGNYLAEQQYLAGEREAEIEAIRRELSYNTPVVTTLALAPQTELTLQEIF